MLFFKNENWITVTCNGKEEEMPVDWVQNKKLNSLSSICKVKGGKAFQAKNFLNNGFGKVIKIKNVGFGKIRYDNLSYISKEEADKSSDFLLKNLDIVISMTGSSFNAPNSLVGRVAIVNELDANCYMNQRVGLLKFLKPVSEKFWFYFMSLKRNQHFLVKNATGSANQVNISNDLIESINIPNIELEEQLLISSVLSTQEKIINNTKNILNELENRNNFIVNELFSGRLCIKEVNGSYIFYKNPNDNWKSVQVNGETIDIPKDWNIVKLNNKFIQKKKSKIKAGNAKKEGLYPFYNCSETQTLYSDTFLLDEEVLFLSTGGKPAIHYTTEKSSYSTDVWAISFTSDLSNKFIYYYLSNNIQILEKCFKGSALKHLNKKDFSDTEVKLPPSQQQLFLVQVLDKMFNEIKTYQDILNEEERVFNFLLEELMSGRLRVKV